MGVNIRGENNMKARLTVSKVKRIRLLYEAYKDIQDPLPKRPNNRFISAKKLALKFKVSPSTVVDLLARKTWKYI